MPERTGISVRRVLTPARLVLAGVVVAALVLRWSLFSIESGDYRAFVDPWYRHLAEGGGFAALGDTFSNYNTPYLVLLAAATYLPVPELVAIKSISVIFDLLLAVFTYKIIRLLRRESLWQPVIGTGLVLFLPTVVMNSSAWGQCDSIYVSLCVGSLYVLITSGHARKFVGARPAQAAPHCVLLSRDTTRYPYTARRRGWRSLRSRGDPLVGLARHPPGRRGTLDGPPGATTGRPWPASAIFGLAFAFKLQAIFFLPVLVAILIINRQRIRSLLAAPAAFGLALVPAMLAGRGLLSQLSVYPAQIGGGAGAPAGGPGLAGGDAGRVGSGPGPGGGFGPGGGGRGGFSLTDGYSYTFNAPTPYAWLPANASPLWMYVGLVVAAAVPLGFGIWLLARRRRLAVGEVIMVAAAATLLIPLLLPQMHERYFYLAEVLTVIAAFVDRRFALAAIGIQAASISTYLAYLENARNLPLGLTAAVALGAALAAVVVVVLRLRGIKSVFRRGRLLIGERSASW